MIRYLVVAGIIAAVFAVLWASTDHAREPADFRFINRGSITTLDPAAMSWMQDIRLGLTVWEGLYRYDPETTEPIPGCAFPARISNDRRTYTFEIRPEARWHTGEPVTAHDFQYGWRRAFEPGTAADYAFFFDHIVGVKEYVAWRLAEIQRIGAIADRTEKRRVRDAHLAEADRRFCETVGIRVLDERTLEVELVRPVHYFLDLCAFSIFVPVHRQAIEPFKIVSDSGLIYYNEQWPKPGNACYNGPFYITDWQFKRSMWLARNPHYWQADTVKLDTLEMLDIEDRNTAWLFYSSGRVDWLSEASVMVYTPRLIADSGSPVPGALNTQGTRRDDIHAFPAFGTYFYNFNCTDRLPDGAPNPFVDPRVRQAFTMAVDKQKIVDQVVRKGNPVATTFIPVGSIPGYPTVTGRSYDPDRARQLLAEAGYPDGNGFPEVVILVNTGFEHEDIGLAVIGMWERNLGIQGRIEGKEVKTFRIDKKNVNFVVCRASWFGDYGDPTTFLDMFRIDNGNNDSGYHDPAYDAMLDAAEAQTDPQHRLEMLAEAERYLVNETLPLLPMYQYVNVFAFRPDQVRNLHLTPRMMTMLRVVEVNR